MSLTPQISIQAGTKIGYAAPLCHCPETLELGYGNHFLLGRNGRGKTTLLRSIAGLIPLLDGHSEIAGKVFYVSEDLAFDRELTAKAIFRSFLAKAQRKDALEFAEAIELDIHKPFAELSTGNQRKLCLIAGEFSAAAHPAPVILLDEPYTGLDDKVREALRQLWEQTEDRVCRLIVAHPDQDTFALPSALTISEGEIKQLAKDGSRTWEMVREQLS